MWLSPVLHLFEMHDWVLASYMYPGLLRLGGRLPTQAFYAWVGGCLPWPSTPGWEAAYPRLPRLGGRLSTLAFYARVGGCLPWPSTPGWEASERYGHGKWSVPSLCSLVVPTSFTLYSSFFIGGCVEFSS